MLLYIILKFRDFIIIFQINQEYKNNGHMVMHVIINFVERMSIQQV